MRGEQESVCGELISIENEVDSQKDDLLRTEVQLNELSNRLDSAKVSQAEKEEAQKRMMVLNKELNELRVKKKELMCKLSHTESMLQVCENLGDDGNCGANSEFMNQLLMTRY